MDAQAERVLQECRVDGTTQLRMKDLPYVRAALINVSAEWYNIGVHFRIHVNTLDQIKRENRRDCDRCLTAMIAEWLKNDTGDPPTWKKVVAAIASRVGGDNPSEAKRIAQDCSYTVEVPTLSEHVDNTPLTLGSLDTVISVLMGGVAHKWMEIGLLLGIRYFELQMLKSESDELKEMVRGVVHAWLKEKHNTQVFGRPSWRKLVEVVGARAGGNHAALAQEIARKHSATVANAQTSQETVTSTVQATGSASTATSTSASVNPSTAAQQSNVVDEGPPLGIGDLVDVSGYLNVLSKDRIFQLGLVLGLLAVPTLDNMRYTANFLPDMLAAWLRGQDNVNKRGGHTWGALVNALRDSQVAQNEIADRIQREKCHTD